MVKKIEKHGQEWALILGASSGFGGATAVELSKHGYNIFGVHLDRNSTMPNVHKIIKAIESHGKKAEFFNMNAADHIQRTETLEEMQQKLKSYENAHIKVLVHSLAFGSLRPYIGANQNDSLTQAQMEMTIDVMANSLVYWVQGIIFRNLMRPMGKIFAITSSGSMTVIPSYGAISAAKCALESHVRQLALELGPRGISVNAILAGVTDTPALRKIPNSDKMIDVALKKNPNNRLTSPIDVAKAIATISNLDSTWISGGIIHCDGGESVVSYVG
jgi:enoyl-[acyl-carrier-protein] reductase (NADH)